MRCVGSAGRRRQPPALICGAHSSLCPDDSGPSARPSTGGVGGSDGVAPRQSWRRAWPRALPAHPGLPPGRAEQRVSGRAATALAAVLAAPRRTVVSTLPACATGLPVPGETLPPAGRSLSQSRCAGSAGAGSPMQVPRRARHTQAGPAPGAAARAALSQGCCRGGRVPTLSSSAPSRCHGQRCPLIPPPPFPRAEACDGRALPQPGGCPRLTPRLRNPATPGHAMPCHAVPRQRPRILLHTSSQQRCCQDPAVQSRGSCGQAPALTWGEAPVPREVTCLAALWLGFYSLQIETEPRRALPKPLTQHMAGRRDRAEQRRCCREADELGCRDSRSPGPPGTGSGPRPRSSGAGASPLGSAGTPATCPVPAWGWAGTVPPSSGSAAPARRQHCLPHASPWGVDRFSHLHLREVGGKTRLPPAAVFPLPARAERLSPTAGAALSQVEHAATTEHRNKRGLGARESKG